MEVHIMSSYFSKIYKNAIKAENEVVKASINEDKPFNWYYGEYTEGNCKYDCLTEGHVLIAFGFNTFVLNKEVFETNNKTLNISQLLDKKDLSYEPAQLTGAKIEGKDIYCILETATGEKIYFNKKYQKYFTDDVEYKVYDSKSLIKIYSGDIFMGVIMPVMVKE